MKETAKDKTLCALRIIEDSFPSRRVNRTTRTEMRGRVPNARRMSAHVDAANQVHRRTLQFRRGFFNFRMQAMRCQKWAGLSRRAGRQRIRPDGMRLAYNPATGVLNPEGAEFQTRYVS